MGSYVAGFRDIDGGRAAEVGGKGAGLAELARIEGVHVPPGFCVTTRAFERMIADVDSIADRVDRLALLRPDQGDRIRGLSREVRDSIEDTVVPDDVAAAIAGALARLGDAACAVRSSATTEDLPGASFAGQQDTFLNVVGAEAVLAHVRRCWASLFTERAVAYRLATGSATRPCDGGGRPADGRRRRRPACCSRPTRSRRTAGSSSVEAVLRPRRGAASGLVAADVYMVRGGEVRERRSRRSRRRPRRRRRAGPNRSR